MTISKLSALQLAPQILSPIESTPNIVRPVAMFNEGSTSTTAVDQLESAALRSLPPAPASSVMRRAGRAADPRLRPNEPTLRDVEQVRVGEMKALFSSPEFQERLGALHPNVRAQVLPVYQNLQNTHGFLGQPSDRRQALLDFMQQAESWTPQNQPLLFR